MLSSNHGCLPMTLLMSRTVILVHQPWQPCASYLLWKTAPVGMAQPGGAHWPDRTHPIPLSWKAWTVVEDPNTSVPAWVQHVIVIRLLSCLSNSLWRFIYFYNSSPSNSAWDTVTGAPTDQRISLLKYIQGMTIGSEALATKWHTGGSRTKIQQNFKMGGRREMC